MIAYKRSLRGVASRLAVHCQGANENQRDHENPFAKF